MVFSLNFCMTDHKPKSDEGSYTRTLGLKILCRCHGLSFPRTSFFTGTVLGLINTFGVRVFDVRIRQRVFKYPSKSCTFRNSVGLHFNLLWVLIKLNQSVICINTYSKNKNDRRGSWSKRIGSDPFSFHISLGLGSPSLTPSSFLSLRPRLSKPSQLYPAPLDLSLDLSNSLILSWDEWLDRKPPRPNLRFIS